jgi:2-keto-4-pentenoate hydratase/2-oxohepta-3-ene-1,7-dioic acid hydratase in catechol pathway
MFSDPVPSASTSIALSEVTLLAPCTPGKFFALWNNFRAAAQKNGWAEPTEPLYFLKASNSFSAHQHPVVKPRCFEGRVLYEGELGIVIGKRGKNIALEDAASHVFGVTCVNDVTALDLLRADTSFEQWTRSKSFDTFTPFGPCIATGLHLESLSVRTLVGTRERQNYPVSDMFFSPLALVSRLSRDVTLEPGDVISCGTSLGAMPWNVGVTVEVHIDGIGCLQNTMTEETT